MGWFTSARKNKARQSIWTAAQARRRWTLVEQLETRQMLSGEPLTSLDGDYLANWETFESDSSVTSSLNDSLFKADANLVSNDNDIVKPLTADKGDYYYY